MNNAATDVHAPEPRPCNQHGVVRYELRPRYHADGEDHEFVYLPLRLRHAVTREMVLASTTCEVADSMRMGHRIPTGEVNAENEDDDVIRRWSLHHLRYNLADYGANGITKRAVNLTETAVRQTAEGMWEGVERRAEGVEADIHHHAERLTDRALAVLPNEFVLDIELDRDAVISHISGRTAPNMFLARVFRNTANLVVTAERERMLRELAGAAVRDGQFEHYRGGLARRDPMILVDILFPDMAICWRDAVFTSNRREVCALHAEGRTFEHRWDEAGNDIPSDTPTSALPGNGRACTMERILPIYPPAALRGGS